LKQFAEAGCEAESRASTAIAPTAVIFFVFLIFFTLRFFGTSRGELELALGLAKAISEPKTLDFSGLE